MREGSSRKRRSGNTCVLTLVIVSKMDLNQKVVRDVNQEERLSGHWCSVGRVSYTRWPWKRTENHVSATDGAIARGAGGTHSREIWRGAGEEAEEGATDDCTGDSEWAGEDRGNRESRSGRWRLFECVLRSRSVLDERQSGGKWREASGEWRENHC